MLVRDGERVGGYQSLMNAGMRLGGFITSLTGISNQMIRAAQAAAQVIQGAAAFVCETPLIAHNASFDFGFWDAELARIGLSRSQPDPDGSAQSQGGLMGSSGLPGTRRAIRMRWRSWSQAVA
jgi:DNA polymerase III alpha subunit (gram-positive type)